jgi:hypothetical protein
MPDVTALHPKILAITCQTSQRCVPEYQQFHVIIHTVTSKNNLLLMNLISQAKNYLVIKESALSNVGSEKK